MKAKSLLATAALATLLGGGAAATAYSLVDVPEPSEVAVTAPIQHGISKVEVHDPGNVLNESDEARMLRDAGSIDTVSSVQQLHYIVFDKNRDNVNDSVEEYLRDNRPELIGKDKFADGVLIVGVGLDPRQAFVFAGEDVADDLDLREGSHLDKSLDAIKPGVKDNNIPAGLFAGVREATDVEKLAESRIESAESDRTAASVVSGLVTGGGLVLGSGIWAAARQKREKKLAQAREDLAFVSKEYGELAQRLDGIDIRANSLTSPLAHATLRSQWAEVRDHFLDLHDQVDRFGGLTTSAEPKQILAQAEEIGSAAEVARKVGYAEGNIDALFKLENGDEVVRKQETTELRADIVAAQGAVTNTDSGLFVALTQARAEADALLRDVAEPNFLERYAQLLSDYQAALTTLKAQEFSDVKKPKTQPEAPAIYDQNYRPGYGYADFVPYWALSTWHSDAVAAQAEVSSSTNSSFSSGFSGAGGSSSF